MNYINTLKSEWIKTKKSSASWLSLLGGFFIPTILLIACLVEGESIDAIGGGKGNSWNTLFSMGWSGMAQFLLPMGMILAASMITQIEYKNNTWKQVHASPQSYPQIFFTKFLVIVLMAVKFFVFFNIGLLIAGTLSTLFIDGGLPQSSFPLADILKMDIKYFIACLPILAIQYLLSLRFKNFLTAVGIGMLGLIGSLIGMVWEHIYISPYAYTIMQWAPIPRDFSVHWYALIYFVPLMVLGYATYISKGEKG